MSGFAKVFGCMLLLLVLISCAMGTRFKELLPSTKPPEAEVGRIFFYKVSSFGTALRPKVLLNGEKIGEVTGDSFFYLDRPPGDYELVISTDVEHKTSFVLNKGQTIYIRFSTSFGFISGYVYGEVVDEAKALSEIQNCVYTGAKTTAK